MGKTNINTLIREFLFKNWDSLIIEAALTSQQLEKADEYFKIITKNKHSLVKRYGKDAEKVVYGRAINMAKKSTKEMNNQKLKELVRKSLMDNTIEETIDSQSYLENRKPIEVGHKDNEPHMIKAELYQIGKYAMELYAILEEYDEMETQVDFPSWWQEKITTAKIMMSGAKNYLEFELKEPMIDKAIDMATGEEPHEGEPESHMMNTTSREIDEKHLTPAEKKKKEEIVKAMKSSFKGPKPVMYAIATSKAKKVAEGTLAEKIMNKLKNK